MANDDKSNIPGPKPGENAGAAKQPPADPKPVVEAKPVVDRQAATNLAEAKAKHPDAGFPPVMAQALAESNSQKDEDFLDADFKRAQSGAQQSPLSPVDIVASLEPEHTVDKGLTPDGQSASGAVPGDRPLGRY